MSTESYLQPYIGDHGAQYHQRHELPESMLFTVAQARAGKFQRWVSPHARVFEYGVGAGYNLIALPAVERVGYDVSDHFESQLTRYGVDMVPEIHEQLYGRFDLVICHHVLEHVRNPAETLEAFGLLVNRAGKVIVHVPYEKERQYRTYMPGEPNHHLYSWTPQTIGALCAMVGFEVQSVRLQKFGYDRFAAVLASHIGKTLKSYLTVRAALLAIRPHYEIEVVLQPRCA